MQLDDSVVLAETWKSLAKSKSSNEHHNSESNDRAKSRYIPVSRRNLYKSLQESD